MDYPPAIVLGIVQGLGEFLPISSSGHLILVPRVFHWADQGLAYDIALHWGTLAALAAYFWKDWLELLRAGLSREETPERRLLWGIVIGTAPAAIAGLALQHAVEDRFRDARLVASTLAAFGALLAAADRLGRKDRDLRALTLPECLWIGAAQALAIVPGVSRSGITITAALFLGLKREDAARFSFLLSAPVVFAAGVLKLKHIDPSALTGPFWAGIAVSFATGSLALGLLLRYVRTRSLTPFAVYRVGLAVLVFAVGSGRL